MDLDAPNSRGNLVGEIHLCGETTKTHRARTVGLGDVSPALRTLLAVLKLRAGREAGYVFGGATPYTADLVDTARARLMREYGSPASTWQALRCTCAAYLTNAPGIFGAATAYMRAKQLGHSVAVAERHYTGLLRGVPCDARSVASA